MSAFYNEIEPYCGAWLNNLIEAKAIAKGIVDTKSITLVRSSELKPYKQAHFFAGIGAWSYALRLAGWPDTSPVWTGSCPCQPFSVAGSGKGFDDERHLWPKWFSLIQQCKPPIIFGEQVASKAAMQWFDTVSSDLESAGYSVGSADIAAASVGAPHRRQRLYFVAIANGINGGLSVLRQIRRIEATRRAAPCAMAYPDGNAKRNQPKHGLSKRAPDAIRCREDGIVAHRCGPRCQGENDGGKALQFARFDDVLLRTQESNQQVLQTWRFPQWAYSRDKKIRPLEPGTKPLVNWSSENLGQVRAYGNAIVPQVAATFIRSVMDLV